MQVIDNLLPNLFFNKLKNIFDKNQFNWFWNNKTASVKDGDLDNHSPVKGLLRMKLNLYTNQNKKIYHAKHIDFTNQDTDKPLENTTNTVLNFTDCNGGTIIDNKEYLSKANQALIFSNDLIHQGIVQTDAPIRIVLNVGIKNKNT